ncbi:hypothetical protein BGZ99_009793 [Dissophora globulifera]|uniref:Uncharacterized protein n=1 Tax=Dissophora globulifera TaxID=979702 RepID=A0A9P6R8G5_9FUNG|nr:hypothetical protein BGZ99_009793 [Dissophora globulifera]
MVSAVRLSSAHGGRRRVACVYVASVLVLLLVATAPTVVHSIPLLQESAAADPPAIVTEIMQQQQQQKQPKKQPKYSFEVLNPSPNDVWTSGTLMTFSWIHDSLPPSATFDIALIPADPETNPEALTLTRRPFLRYIEPWGGYLDVVVPYDLISMKQLREEQERDGALIKAQDDDVYEDLSRREDLKTDTVNTVNTTTKTATMTTTTTIQSGENDVESKARLFFTAYEGRTNKVLVQRSVFPVFVRKNRESDKRTVLPPPPGHDQPSITVVQGGSSGEYDVLEKKDSELANLDDEHHDFESQIQEDEKDEEEVGVEEEDEDEDEDEDEEKEEPLLEQEEHLETDAKEQNTQEGGGDGVLDELLGPTSNGTDALEQDNEINGTDELEQDNEINSTTPTGLELGEQDEEQNQVENKNEDEMPSMDMENQGHDHTIDIHHLQTDEDFRLQEEHIDEPGYQPPIKVIDAGTIEVTRWTQNKTRFYVGAPYVIAWSLPAAGRGLTGSVSVYVEDAFTSERYDIAAGNMPSDVQFMYLRPTEMMMSTTPGSRIYLRARVELDLFKNGNLDRYTGFSKMFFVVRGAL